MEAIEKQEKRPLSVVLFEAIGVLGGVASMVLSQGESAFTELFDLLIQVGLTLWVTRGRSRLGRLLYTGFLLFGAAALAGAFLLDYVPADAVPALAVSVLFELAVFLSLLWWPTTTAWLKGK